jgi:peptide/nickel transport system substrate-binding protein
MKTQLLITLSMLFLNALLAACGETGVRPAASGEDDRMGGVAVVCIGALPESLHSFVSADQDASDFRVLLFTPLVLYDSTGNIRPHLAREWEWQNDQQQLVLRLRPDVRWHDGEKVTAEDVAWTLRSAADTAYAYPNWDDLSSLRDVIVRDSLTVEVLFDGPFISGLEPFAQLPILPHHLLSQVPAAEFARAAYHRAPVGSGPFRFVGRMADGALQFDRFADFPEELGRARLDRLVVRAVPEPSSMLIEMQTGNIDLCVSGASFARQVEAAPELVAMELPPLGVQQIQLATGIAPLNDVRVRRAISAALRRAELAAVVSPLARPARTYLPGGSEHWLAGAELQPDADSALAAALLDSAGWSVMGADRLRRNAAGMPLRFTVVAPLSLENVLTVVQSQLRSVGIDLRMQFMEGASFVAMVYNPSARPPAIALSIFPDKFTIPDPAGQLHSRGSFNFTGWGGTETDSLIERLSTLISDEERTRVYQQLQHRVTQEVPIVYTLFFPLVVAVGPRVQGVRTDLNGPYTSVSEWWIPAAQRRRTGGATPPDTTTPAAEGTRS